MKKYVMPYRRRREGLTNYQSRLKLLKSRTPRLVVRKSDRHVRVQLVAYTSTGDQVLASASSQELKALGWTYATANIPAAYLTGFLCGTRASKAKQVKGVLDIGLAKPISGSRIFAALKGAIDAGMQVPASPEAFPSEERLQGAHIATYAATARKEGTVQFATYTDKAAPDKLTATITQVKSSIEKGSV